MDLFPFTNMNPRIYQNKTFIHIYGHTSISIHISIIRCLYHVCYKVFGFLLNGFYIAYFIRLCWWRKNYIYNCLLLPQLLVSSAPVKRLIWQHMYLAARVIIRWWIGCAYRWLRHVVGVPLSICQNITQGRNVVLLLYIIDMIVTTYNGTLTSLYLNTYYDVIIYIYVW